MKNVSVLKAALLIGVASVGASANAATIGFEGANGFNANTTTSFIEGAYTLTYIPVLSTSGFASVNNSPTGNCLPDCAVNGTNIFQSFNTGKLVITLTGGGAFSAAGFDAAQTFTTLNRALNLNVSATTSGGPLLQNFTTAAGGADVFSTYALTGFGDILSLTFEGVSPYPEVEFELDNIELGAAIGAVPEPATWAMMLAGFGIVGSAMRRRQRVSVSFG